LWRNLRERVLQSGLKSVDALSPAGIFDRSFGAVVTAQLLRRFFADFGIANPERQLLPYLTEVGLRLCNVVIGGENFQRFVDAVRVPVDETLEHDRNGTKTLRHC